MFSVKTLRLKVMGFTITYITLGHSVPEVHYICVQMSYYAYTPLHVHHSSNLLKLHKPNPWCLRMANPEPLPQRATQISRRLRGQEPVLSRESGRENSTPSLHHYLTQRDIKTEKMDVAIGRVTYDHLRDSALLLSYLLTCHPYIPFHFM